MVPTATAQELGRAAVISFLSPPSAESLRGPQEVLLLPDGREARHGQERRHPQQQGGHSGGAGRQGTAAGLGTPLEVAEQWAWGGVLLDADCGL